MEIKKHNLFLADCTVAGASHHGQNQPLGTTALKDVVLRKLKGLHFGSQPRGLDDAGLKPQAPCKDVPFCEKIRRRGGRRLRDAVENELAQG